MIRECVQRMLDVTGCYWLLLAAGQAVCALQVREIPMRPHQLWRCGQRSDATLHWITLDCIISIDIYLAAARANTEMSLALESADYPSTKESKSKVALGVG